MLCVSSTFVIHLLSFSSLGAEGTVVYTDDKLGEKFENLTGRKATCMQKSNVSA